MNLRDLAQLANLSTAAVSLALNDSPKISEATKERVKKLAKENGYQADARVVELMKHLRTPRDLRKSACFAVISFYDTIKPWSKSLHLTRVYEGMQTRADQLGYRLEALWIKEPGMTYKRFRSILEARSIEGLLCFGSPDLNQEFPSELDCCATVTQGLSIRTPLHRIINHAYHDTIQALTQLHERGYRRPGIVLGQYEDLRSAHTHSAAYLGWCELNIGRGGDLPILRMNELEPEQLTRWYKRHKPDAMIIVHTPSVLSALKQTLQTIVVNIPQDLGVVVISPVVEGSGFSGIQENQALMGERTVELLVARIANQDFGIPKTPRVEMVEGHWVEGQTIRAN